MCKFKEYKFGKWGTKKVSNYSKNQSAHVVEGGNQNTDSHTAIPKEWK